ncbi:MAG: hypothetical protein GY768_08370 [Planctomycetaceae bacterium]|nr:hypothetical protein [Planctomycetaceae bacterium]
MVDATSHPEQSSGLHPRVPVASRWALLILCLLLVSAWLFPRLFVRGLVFPVRVVEGSMAPHLCGDHFQVHCPHCANFFRVDTRLPDDLFLSCPRCQNRFEYEPVNPTPGDRVIINRWDGRISNIQRWDLVAVNDPLNAKRLMVKRVVALPGERVSIEHGNVVVDGKLVTKSLDQLRDVAILVSDEPDSQQQSITSAWLPVGSEGGWSWANGTWAYSRNATAAEVCSWLVFSPKGSFPDRSAVVLDDYSYNQSTSRERKIVNDLLLTVEVKAEKCAQLKFRVEQSNQVWELTLDFDRHEVQLGSENRNLSLPPISHQISRIELAICDGQLLLGINGEPVLIESAMAIHGVGSPVISIGARSGNLKIDRLSVARDIFYLPPSWAVPLNDFFWQLSPDEFFLLGDNCPISIDSRDPRYGPFDRSNMLGTVRRRTR